MTLGAAEHPVQHDPDAAKVMIARAKELSVTALGELRELIRGIQPPILADRGLADAARWPWTPRWTWTTRVNLPGQAAEPIEAAVYFAVSELLAKLELRHESGVLKATVTDNGRGGATVGRGGGLHGIRHHLDGFDGVLTHQPDRRTHRSRLGDPMHVVLAEDVYLLEKGSPTS